MFWGLIMEPQRRYSQTVKRGFHLSMAALDESTSDDSPTQVICSFDDRNYLLCTLVKGQVIQVNLDLNFEIGDKISFATNGKAHVHLTGYLLEGEYSGEGLDEDDVDDFVSNEVTTRKKRQKKDLLNGPPQKKSKTLELLEAVKSEDEDDSDDSDVNMTDLLEEDDDDDDLDTTAFDEADDDDEGGVEAEEEEDDDFEEEEDSDEDEEDIGAEESEDASSMSDDETVEKPVKLKENGISPKKEKKLKEKQLQSPEKEKQPQRNEKQRKDKSTKGDKTPGKGDKALVKSDKTPGKGDKALIKSDKTPGKGDKAQIKSEKTPGKHDKTPGKGDRSPTKGDRSPSPQKQAQTGSSPQKRTVEGGVIVEDVKIGNGPVAKPGKFIKVYYEGRLRNSSKVFDSVSKGSGFEFRLGRQEVIKGWDVGVSGMKVGGKRRIICPPNMGYGQKGSLPTIPPNSTLVFDIELKNVK